MSGLCGFVRLDGAPAAREAAAAMARALAHRGPHGGGELVVGPVGLAHRMLRATPEAEREAQPLSAGDCAIVADLRLDHRDELKRALGLRGDPGDAALVLAAYARWADDCVRHLRGDFAFALWDARRRRLFCARDPFGARPFVYSCRAALFAFGSEAGAVLALPEVPRALNEERIGDFLVEGYHEGFDTRATFFRDVLRLPAAHTLTVELTGVATLSRYWSVLGARSPAPVAPRDAAAGFREVLAGAVQQRLRGPAVGSMLSGGLDSSSIVALGAQLRRERGQPPLPTFSCVDEDGAASGESALIAALSRLPAIAPTLIRPRDVAALAGAFDALCATADEPFAVMELPLLTYAAGAKAGLTAILDGVDGDLVASRNGALRFALLTGHWRWAWRDARHQAAWGGRPSPLGPLWEEGLRPVVRGAASRVPWLWARWRARPRARYETAAATCFVRRAFADRIDLDGRRRRATDHFFPPSLVRATPDEEYAHWLESGLVTSALERYDRVAASQGIEPRHPFLDVDVVSFYLGVPWDAPVNQGLPKAIIRHAMASGLPRQVLEGTWQPNLHEAMRAALIAARPVDLRAALANEGDVLSEYVDMDALRASGRDDDEPLALIRLFLLAAWLRRASAHDSLGRGEQ